MHIFGPKFYMIVMVETGFYSTIGVEKVTDRDHFHGASLGHESRCSFTDISRFFFQPDRHTANKMAFGTWPKGHSLNKMAFGTWPKGHLLNKMALGTSPKGHLLNKVAFGTSPRGHLVNKMAPGTLVIAHIFIH